MSETVIVAIIALVGTLTGTFGGIMTSNKLTGYRIEQLEKKVDKHNNVIERTALLEQTVKEHSKVIDKTIELERCRAVLEERISSMEEDIDFLKTKKVNE